jgi:hypothetical protein
VMRAGTRGACEVVAVCACASGLCPAATIRGSANANNKAPRIAHRLRPILLFFMNPPATWSLLLSCPASRPDPLARKATLNRSILLGNGCPRSVSTTRSSHVDTATPGFSRAEAGYRSGIANSFLSIPPDFVHGSRGPGLGGEGSSASSVIRIQGMTGQSYPHRFRVSLVLGSHCPETWPQVPIKPAATKKVSHIFEDVGSSERVPLACGARAPS